MKKFIFAALCGLLITAGFSSCSDDDDDSWLDGSKIEIPEDHAFVLNEGSYGKNNTSLYFFNTVNDTVCSKDLFETQNGIKLGDTGQSIIADGDNVYLAVYGSNYIARLNKAGVLQGKVTVDSKLGGPRYMACLGNSLYVSCYGGYLAKYDAETLAFEDSVKIGANPEQIIYMDGKLYVACSGGMQTVPDNRIAVVSTSNFKSVTYNTTLTNPCDLADVDGTLFVRAYDTDYSNPIAYYDTAKSSWTKIGNGNEIAAYGSKLYVANSVTDWTTYATTTTFYSYDMTTGKTADLLSDIPSELSSSSVYVIAVNDEDGNIYVGATDYYTNGVIYHFDKAGKYIGKFSSNGLNPNSILFFD